MDSNTLSSLTTTPRCHSSGRYHHPSVMLQKPSQCSRSCSQSMEFLRPSDLTMDHNLLAINLLSLLRSGTLITPQVHLGTQGVMAKPKLLSRLQKVSSPVPSTQDRTPSLPCWHTGAHPSMLTFVHPAEMLYQRAIRTTVPQRIRHKDPQATADRDHLNDRATQSAAYHDRHCRPKSLLYAGQTVSVLNDAKTFWLPATVIRQAKHGSYLVQVIGRGQYKTCT